ncbi:MAG TPA: Gfo/Idh/MocA family oxidoreductase [Bryobacteraceae bacterium]|nr:Gfo/Idh/MocA family oxidoreductase [Bryobacteraceae bacterium]
MGQDRRTFLQTGGAAVAASFLNLNPRAAGANDKIALALIGGRNQGRHDAIAAIKQGAEIKTFCDIDDAVLAKSGAQIEQAQDKKLAFAKDYRRVLDDKSIDGVIIATPDHWHANIMIAACQAGKDVYVEKPLSQTIHEGQLMRDAARKYNRVVQVGTQRRSMEHFKSAVEYVASGKLGKICMIKAWMCQVRPSIGNPPDGTPPAGVDYDTWLGPAPERPFNPNRFHYNWRFFWDYGNTELGNQGVHMLDVAMWAIEKMRGLDNCLPRHVSGTSGIYWLNDAKEVPDTQVLNYDYGDFALVWELRSFAKHHPIEGADGATAFYGTDATLIADDPAWTVYDKNDKVVETVKSSGGSHAGNFLECMRSRQQPNADVELGRLSTTICHLGNITTHLKRDVRFDAKAENFGADKEANAYLTKRYRAPYELPKV